MKELDSSVNKVGAARKVPGSRIWLEGKRLTASGFAPGKTCYAIWNGQAEQLTLLLEEPESGPFEVRTISGKDDKPIIDITGAKVRDFFTASHVEVSYYAGRIVIREAS